MSRRQANDIYAQKYAAKASKLYHDRLEREESYARFMISTALHENEEADLREERSARRLKDVHGAEMCLQRLKDITNSEPIKIIIPELGNMKIPRFTSWIPITRDFWSQEWDDVITRYPIEAIGTKEFRTEEFSVTMKEYGEFREKWKLHHSIPSVQEIEESRLDEAVPFELQRKIIARTDAISKVLKSVRPEFHIKIAPVLRDALEIDESMNIERIVSVAFEEVRKREQRLKRRIRRAETVVAMTRGLSDECTPCITIDSPNELVDQVLKHYCPLCYIMSCDLHATVEYRVTPINPILDQFVEDRRAELFQGNPTPCSVRCYMLLDKPQFGKVESNELQRWTEEEIALLEMSIPVFERDPCSLSTVIGTRTCREVFMKIYEPNWSEWIEAAIDVAKKPRHTKEMDVKEDWRFDEGVKDHFVPCNHEGPCTRKVCPCVFLNLRCESACGCNNVRYCEGPDEFGMCEVVHPTQRHPPARAKNETLPIGKCSNLWRGCSCKPGRCDRYCPCWIHDRPCQPGLCACMSTTAKCSKLITGKCSCETKNGKCAFIPCRNTFISQKITKRTTIGKSPVHGYGLYAVESIRRGDYIGIYTGQLMSQYISEILAFGFDTHDHTFLFDWTEFVTSDATVMGSLMKFINHAGPGDENLNCASKKQITNGVPIIAYYATRNISPGEELFIDYKFQNNKPDWMTAKESSK